MPSRVTSASRASCTRSWLPNSTNVVTPLRSSSATVNVALSVEGGLRAGVAVLEVARIAFDDLALLRHADFEERLAVVHWASGVGDQPMRGAMAGVDVGVDKAGRDQLAGGVDRCVDRAVEGFADMHDLVAFIDHNPVVDQPMMAAFVADDPARFDQGPHRNSVVATAVQPPVAYSRPARGPTTR